MYCLLAKEILTLKVRYKKPDGDKSELLTFPCEDSNKSFARAGGEFQFAASVAAFGMILRGSPYKGNATLRMVHELAGEGKGVDKRGYRQEFMNLVRRAAWLGE